MSLPSTTTILIILKILYYSNNYFISWKGWLFAPWYLHCILLSNSPARRHWSLRPTVETMLESGPRGLGPTSSMGLVKRSTLSQECLRNLHHKVWNRNHKNCCQGARAELHRNGDVVRGLSGETRSEARLPKTEIAIKIKCNFQLSSTVSSSSNSCLYLTS